VPYILLLYCQENELTVTFLSRTESQYITKIRGCTRRNPPDLMLFNQQFNRGSPGTGKSREDVLPCFFMSVQELSGPGGSGRLSGLLCIAA
jgi:hypothetical protein